MKQGIAQAARAAVIAAGSAAALFSLGALGGCTKQEAAETGRTGRPRVTFMLIDYEGSPLSGNYSQQVIDRMTEWTDTDVEFKFTANDSYEEKLGLALANPKSMPMVMHVGAMNLGIVDAANADAFWDLNEFIWDEKKFPNLSKANKDISRGLTVGGKLIGIYKARELGRYGLGYRKDWADRLGLGEPKTVEDVYNMLKAFTERDPDGDGIKNTYGLALCKYTGPFDIIQTWFGCGNGWVEENGVLLPVHQTAAYKDALDWLRKVYTDGYIAPDWAVRDTATWQDQVKKGESGVFVDVVDSSRRIWDYFVKNEVPSAYASDETAAMQLVGAINGKTLAISGTNGFLVVTKAAKTREQVEACLHFIDKMCDDEMMLLAQYGLKDIHYEIDADGYIVSKIAGVPGASKAFTALNQTQCSIPKMIMDIRPSTRKTERQLEEERVMRANRAYAVHNPALAYLPNSATYATQGAILDQLLSDARTQYICGQIDEQGLQAAFEKWNKQGGIAVVKEVNEQYKADASRKK